MAFAVPRTAGAPLLLRGAVLLLALLVPLHLPFSLPEPGGEATLGWWSHGRAARDGGMVVTQTTWYARAAGLAVGDRVVRVGALPASEAAVRAALGGAEVGERVPLRVRRAGTEFSVLVPVERGSLGYTAYGWYRLTLMVASWLVGVWLIAWQGRSPPVLALGAALLLVGPAIVTVALPVQNVVLHGANLLWLHLDAAFRFAFPVLLAHCLVLQHAPPDSRARAPRTWVAAYLAVIAVLAVCTLGFTDPQAWARPGSARTVRTIAGFAAELGALAVAFGVRPGARAASSERWLRHSVMACLAVSVAVSALILVIPDGSASEVDSLRQIKGLALLLVVATASIHCLSLRGGVASDWQLRGRLSTTVAAALTVLFGFAVGGAALVVHARESSLGEIEGTLFLTIFVASIAFSPVLRWAREMVDRQVLARLAEREARIGAFADGLCAVLEPARIAADVAREAPALLDVSEVELVLARERVAAWALPQAEAMDAEPVAALGAEAARPRHGWGAELVPGAGGEPLGLLRVRYGDGRVPGPPEEAALGALARGVASALRIAEAYLRLRRVQDELASAERVASLGALAGGLAHEIKNPLLGLKLGLHLMRRAAPGQEDRVERLADDVRRIDDLVNGLLRFTHDELPVVPGPVDVAEVVRGCVRELRPLAEDRGTELAASCAADDVRVEGTEPQLRLVVSTLVRNALDAAGDSGHVGVSIERGASAEVRECEGAKVEDGGGWMEIRVEDDGPGVPEALRDRIFDLAFSTKPGGSGIGLALARRETERMGGTIRVERAPRAGTRFVVRLPLLRAAPEVMLEAETTTAARSHFGNVDPRGF
jgi:signal transduction histidine kinase